jgi:glycosyltransferase involved in cell wall biosynthesis
MKILHIITGLGNGGAEGVLYRLTSTCSEHEHQVISLTGHGWTSEKLTKAGVSVHALDLGASGSRKLAGLFQLRRLIRSIKPDVVQTWMYHADLLGGMAARLGGLKSIVWNVRASNLSNDRASLPTRGIRWACARLSSVIPKIIVCNSHAGARVHAELGYQRQKIVVIPNGYDVAELGPDLNARSTLRQQWRCPPDQPVLGIVARWDILKDHENLIKALAILAQKGRAFRCALIGPGMNEKNGALMELLRVHGVKENVVLHGPTEHINAVMSALDVHVLSSRAEAFPNTVAEAMACGTPCVVTDVGDAAAIVGDTGWIVPPEDAAALAHALDQAIEALSDRNRWSTRQRASRQRISEHFNLAMVAAEFRAVWQAARA